MYVINLDLLMGHMDIKNSNLFNIIQQNVEMTKLR